MRVCRLPYREQSAELVSGIANEPWSVFLDCGHPRTRQGRWDIVAARPFLTLTAWAGTTRVESTQGVEFHAGDPLPLLRSFIGQTEESPGFPFAGGAIGYFSYDLSLRLGVLADSGKQGPEWPEMAIGLYDWAVLVDHERAETYLVSAGRDPATDAIWDDLVKLFSGPFQGSEDHWQTSVQATSDLPWPRYQAAFQRAMRWIADGDCYQVNLTQLFTAEVKGSSWGLYQSLRRLNPAPFGAFFNHPMGDVLSSSPERFIELRGDQVTTSPIKGTRPRGADQESDQQLASDLANSAKDRAENLMIVDLLRNDLGKVCQTGSVAVPALFEVKSFANVHHLVSTVTGKLAPGRDAIDLLRATFPGGSITGAPKRRAMEIIDELEPHRRGLYCGAIGYIGFNGDMDSNIAIRTLVRQGDTVYFGVGGGIVADSVAEQEYQECLDKAAPMLRLLGSGRDGLVG